MKKLNLGLFKTGFIFIFKGNKHLIVKDYSTEVLVINLDWDNCELLEEISENWCIDDEDTSNVIYKLSYLEIEEDILSSGKDGLKYLIEDDSLENQISIIDYIG